VEAAVAATILVAAQVVPAAAGMVVMQTQKEAMEAQPMAAAVAETGLVVALAAEQFLLQVGVGSVLFVTPAHKKGPVELLHHPVVTRTTPSQRPAHLPRKEARWHILQK
jgi:hypothetical protein